MNPLNGAIFSRSFLVVSSFLLFTAAGRAELPVVTEGEITDISKEIGKLVQLTWSGNRMVIDRNHWLEATGRKSDADKLNDQIAGMVARGIPEAIARRIVEQKRQPGRGGDFLTRSSEGQLFTNLKIAAGATSGGGGGGGDECQWHGRGGGIQAEMSTRDSTKDFRFMIREVVGASQELLVEEHHKKGIRIQFSSPDRNLVFVQGNDGVIQVAHTTIARSEAFRASNYEEMLEKQTAFSKDFHAMLESLGIDRPTSAFEKVVVARVLKRLDRPDAEVRKAAERVIAKLSDSAFQVREDAQKQMAANFDEWENVIREKLDDDGHDAEARQRLRKLLPKPTKIERYIDSRKLLKDAVYLRALLLDAPKESRELIENRISQLEDKAVSSDD